MPVPRCVKGISDTSNNLDNTESIKASLCLFFDHITGSLPTVWADLSLPVPASYVIIASLSFRTSYRQISPLLTNEVSRLPRGMMGKRQTAMNRFPKDCKCTSIIVHVQYIGINTQLVPTQLKLHNRSCVWVQNIHVS